MDTERHDSAGELNAGPPRPAQQFIGRNLHFDLHQEMEGIVAEAAWQRTGRSAKTLVKEPHLHVTLVALRAGARLDQHRTAGPVTIQAVKGLLQLSVEGETIELGPANLLALEAGVPHDVQAIEDSAILITIGWPR